MWGVFGKPLNTAIWNTQVYMLDSRHVRDFGPFWTMPVLFAASFCQQVAAMSSYKFTPRAVASPDAPQKPLTRKRARSRGVKSVQVSRDETGRKAKKPRTSRSQPPACSHKEHAILTTVEATAFAAHFWDRKMHPTKASQPECLATCVRKLRILKCTDFWNVYKWLSGTYRLSSSHTYHQQKPVFIRDEKGKWLDFGSTPDPLHLPAMLIKSWGKLSDHTL